MVRTGPAFPDFVSTEKIKRRKNVEGFSQNLGPRYLLLLVFLVVGGFILFFRLFTLQVLEGQYYRGLSNGNRIKTTVTHAPRGIIEDRFGNPLVYNLPGYREIVKGETKLLTADEALSKISKGDKNLEIDNLRFYPYKDATAQILGYIGQISPDELKNPQYSDYKSGDLIGKMGIEQEYESFLRGVDGKELSEIDSLGKIVRKLGKSDPTPGEDLKLTIDLGLQKKSYDAMKNVKKGALIATTPKGEILALVSKPSFDPNLFTMGENYKTASSEAYQNVEQVISDSINQPLLDRAIGGLYPPGSTFKIVVAAAGLADKIIDTNYTIEDTGIIHIGDFSFSNWYFTGYGRTDGAVNVVKGIKRSNDIFFYKLAEKIGVDKISKLADSFGIGKILGIDISGAAKGLVPTPEWKEKVIGEKWFLGDTYHYGIGQGYLLTSPLHVNSWTDIIATKGDQYEPHFLLDSPLKEKKIGSNLIDQKTADIITEGMVGACSDGGVAWPLFNFKVKNPKLKIDGRNFLEVHAGSSSAISKTDRQVVVACKTGTAEHGDANSTPHAWITLFAPAYNPQIVLTILAEDSGEGSNVAGPIAKEVLTEWFSK